MNVCGIYDNASTSYIPDSVKELWGTDYEISVAVLFIYVHTISRNYSDKNCLFKRKAALVGPGDDQADYWLWHGLLKA